MEVPSDQVIQGTNDDATASKLHAVNRGYWVDPYIRHFCFSRTPKSPEISRGYFVRTQAFKAITMSFIKHNHGECQVVNLGAGSDTLYFILREANLLPRKFVEVDLGYNVMRKIAIMKNRKLFPDSENPPVPTESSRGDTTAVQCAAGATADSSSTEDADSRRTAFHAGPYYIFAFDLRQPVESLIERLCDTTSNGCGLSRTSPTLFLAECVLVYMPSAQTTQLLRGLATNFSSAAFLHYEQVNMMDKFGTIMVQNFRSRGCNLPGLSACQSLLDQERRFHETGWKRTAAWTVNQVYQAFSQATRQRIERVEMLDDVEISQQLFDHYCILYAATDEAQFSWSDLSEPLAQIS